MPHTPSRRISAPRSAPLSNGDGSGRLVPYLFFLLLLCAALGWQLIRDPSYEEREIVQERFDRAAPPLDAEHTLGQTFVSHHKGLKAIEILLVRYEPEKILPPEAQLTLTLERLDGKPTEPVIVALAAGGMEHNQRLRFEFAPLPDSQDAPYRFTLHSNGSHGLSAWVCGLDAYAEGTMLSDGAETPGDVYFTTHYDYPLSAALEEALVLLGRLRKLPSLLLLLGLPGAVLSLYLLPPRRLEIVPYLSLCLALSMVTWPLLLLWASWPGLSLARWRVWLLMILFIAAGAYRLWKRPDLQLIAWQATRRDPLPEIALALILLLTLSTRLLQVRALAVPAWVDSVHHTLVAQIIAESGRVPLSLEPYLPVGDFHYHYGFHANAAVWSWLGALTPDQAVLLLGQVFNALAILPVYALTAAWSEQRWAGVGAALVVGALAYMPAYYVSWGRYTQLTGLLLLPLACLLTSWLLAEEQPPIGLWSIAILLLGGLALTHYRALVFYIAFWMPYGLLALWRRGSIPRGWGRVPLVALVLAMGSLALIAPWALRFAARVLPRVDVVYGGWAAQESYDTTLPLGLLKVGWTLPLLALAAAGAVWAAVRRRAELALVPLWIGLWLLAANLHLLGLPNIWLIHNQTVVISFWLPVGLLCGWLVGDLLALLEELWRRIPWSRLAPRILSWAMLAVGVALAAWGSWRMIDTLNPITIIATAEDVQAMSWIREHTPADALFLINTRKWQGEMRVGTDGGYWLPLLAHRRTTLPCVFYYQGTPSYREEVNGLAQAVEEAASLDDPALIARLREAGVTHVYVGAKGGRLMPNELDPSPHFRMVYAYGPVRVYEFVPQPPG